MATIQMHNKPPFHLILTLSCSEFSVTVDIEIQSVSVASEKKNRTIENIMSVSNIQSPLADGPKDSGFARLPMIPENEIDIF